MFQYIREQIYWNIYGAEYNTFSENVQSKHSEPIITPFHLIFKFPWSVRAVPAVMTLCPLRHQMQPAQTRTSQGRTRFTFMKS